MRRVREGGGAVRGQEEGAVQPGGCFLSQLIQNLTGLVLRASGVAALYSPRVKCCFPGSHVPLPVQGHQPQPELRPDSIAAPDHESRVWEACYPWSSCSGLGMKTFQTKWRGQRKDPFTPISSLGINWPI